jgi:hypothetical protein
MRPPEDLWRFFRLHQSLGAGKVQGRNPTLPRFVAGGQGF